MNYLQLENATRTYGEKVLFDNIDLQISQGEKIALVAKNGSGKTTLLRVLAGLEAPEGETARRKVARNLRIGYLEQSPRFNPDHTIFETVFASENPMIQAIQRYEQAMLHPEDQAEVQAAITRMDDLKAWDFEARIREILSKLDIEMLDKPVGHLSGGQNKRLALAKLIIDEPELLLLDEPTNHLDLDMIEWLEEYLQHPGLTLFMVTHDRYFLERVCNQIIELDRGRLYRYPGNYSDYLEKKAIREDIEQTEQEKARKMLRQELQWVRRMPKARGTKAKARVDAFEDLAQKVDEVETPQTLQIDLKGQRLGKKVLEAHNISKSYGDKCLVQGFSYKFKRRERVGIVGPNGVGKTTFLHLLTQQIFPDTGKVVVGENTVFGYYTQSGMQLAEDRRVIDVVRDIAEFIPLERGQKLTAESLLERFLFPRKQQQVYVSQLSGGERRRLYLLTILMANPNFLILDEPTNDLDIMTLNVLEEFLQQFPGCLIVVTHDRYFLDKITDHLFVFEGEGHIRDFNGDYSAYRAEWHRQQRQSRSEARSKSAGDTREPRPPAALSYQEKKEMTSLERAIEKLEKQKAELSARFAHEDLAAREIEEISIKLGNIDKDIEAKELRWMELAEKQEG